MNAPTRLLCLAWTFAFLAGAAAQAGSKTLKSHWRDREVTIDGVADEWEGARTYFKKEKIDVGVLNDDEYLYLSFVTEDEGVRRQILIQGFKVWASPGEVPSFGLQYPIGMRNSGLMPERQGPGSGPGGGFGGGRPGGGSGGPGPRMDPDKMRETVNAMLDDLEILGPGIEEPVRLSVDEVPGIETAFEALDTRVVYEIKIPLRKTDEQPYSIGLSADAGTAPTISFGFVSPDLELEGRQGGFSLDPGGSHGGGFGGGGGMRGGRGGGMGGPPGDGWGPGGRLEMKPFEVWTELQLATAPAP